MKISTIATFLAQHNIGYQVTPGKIFAKSVWNEGSEWIEVTHFTSAQLMSWLGY